MTETAAANLDEAFCPVRVTEGASCSACNSCAMRPLVVTRISPDYWDSMTPAEQTTMVTRFPGLVVKERDGTTPKKAIPKSPAGREACAIARALAAYGGPLTCE